MQWGEFVDRLGVPLDAVLDVYCTQQISDPMDDDYINVGCSDADLLAAEQRLGQGLHPLHRIILRHSNGGSCPQIGGVIQMWAAAIPREEIWIPVGGAEPGGTPKRWQDEERAFPMAAWVMEWESHKWNPIEARRYGAQGEFLAFATGYDSGLFGYVRGHPAIVDMGHGEPPGVLAADFEAFLRRLRFCSDADLPGREAQIRAALAGRGFGAP